MYDTLIRSPSPNSGLHIDGIFRDCFFIYSNVYTNHNNYYHPAGAVQSIWEPLVTDVCIDVTMHGNSHNIPLPTITTLYTTGYWKSATGEGCSRAARKQYVIIIFVTARPGGGEEGCGYCSNWFFFFFVIIVRVSRFAFLSARGERDCRGSKRFYALVALCSSRRARDQQLVDLGTYSCCRCHRSVCILYIYMHTRAHGI